jgi:hypothetical protein
MRSNRLGCLSGTGILAALVTALVIAGYAYARGGLMYNPGALSTQGVRTLGGVTSHAATDGECKACHVAPWESATMADRCTVCHTEIAGQMRDIATVHGTLFHNDPGLGCRHCHPEHRGTDAALTVMDGKTFPHEVVGYSLNAHPQTVAGRVFQCDDCHQRDITTFAPQTCDTCHRQMDAVFMTAHTLSFGSTCLDCHDGIDRFGKNFDHNAFSFKLTGKHVGVACVQCHVNARGFDDFAVTLQDCYSCHHNDDTHNGQYGTECAACHNPSDWHDASFDHNLSNFPLTGAHAGLLCESCHSSGQFAGLSSDCASCHSDPVFHEGMFGLNCASCHTADNWFAPYTGPHPGIADEGGSGVSHGGASCRDCHTQTLHAATCTACHESNNPDDDGGGNSGHGGGED